MSNKRKLSDIPPCEETPATPSKRASKVSRLQGIGGLGCLDLSKHDKQSSEGANQNTPRKVAEALLSLSGTHSPIRRSTSSWDFMKFDSAQNEANPFWSPAQPSQPGQETPLQLHSTFIPNPSIGSPVPFMLSAAQALSPHAQNILPPVRIGSSSDDSNSLPDTAPREPVFTPEKSVWTLMHPDESPTQYIPSPMQYLSSPSQAVLERLIPLPDKENEDSDDVGPQFFSRSKAISICRKVFNCTPKEQQLEILEHIAKKIDCVLIAPCGWGKTLAFFLPMAYWPGSITAIISPLIALMNDQRQKLVNAKIPHIVLSGDNSDTINGKMIRRICEGEFRAVFMSPEIIFGDSPTSRLVQGLWRNTSWQNLLLAIVVDEVHCVEKWGNKFRPEYARLGELRIWSPGVPFVGVTATFTADALTQTMDKLFLSEANVLRVQEIPTNVRLEIHTQPKDAKKGLSRLLGEDKTIIYFEKISILLDIHKYLSRLRPDLKRRIGVYYSTLTSRFKEAIMAKFVNGDIHILLATEAAGMGCDIPDVVQVIQYGFPRDIASMAQRFGRAARDPKIQGFGILYAPPITKTSPSDKNVRDYLQNQPAGAGRCLWALLDELFQNELRTCNNSCSGCSKLDRPISARTTVFYDNRSSNRRRWPSRSKEEKQMALTRLLEWRKEAYEKWVIRRPFRCGSETWILPNNAAKQLSQNFSGTRTVEAVKAIASSCNWKPLEERNTLKEVAQLLDMLNNEIDACRGSGSQTMAASLDLLEDDSDGDREGSDGEEDLLES